MQKASLKKSFGVTQDKLPPQALEIEKTLLGSLLIDKEAINKVADLIKPEDFYQRGHQIIYQAVMSLFEKREPLDLLSLANKLEEMGYRVEDTIYGPLITLLHS